MLSTSKARGSTCATAQVVKAERHCCAREGASIHGVELEESLGQGYWLHL